MRDIARAHKGLPETCERLASAKGPWTMVVNHVDVALSSEVGIRVINAELSTPGGAPKLGRLRFGGM